MKKIAVKDFDLSRVQDNAIAAFNGLPTTSPIIAGVFIDAVISTLDTAIDHTLRREVVGWLVVDKDANADIWKSSTSNPRPADQIILKASASVNAKLYIF